MKSLNRFLEDINDGQTLAAATADLANLLQAVQSTGRSGSLTIKLRVAPATKGSSFVDKITVTAERKLELPKPEQPQDFFWLTDSGEPTRDHPRQQSLSLQSVRAFDPLTNEIIIKEPLTGANNG